MTSKIVATPCRFENNENSFEVTDADVIIDSCVLEENQRFNPATAGGVTNPFTVALGNRAALFNAKYVVRRSTFLNNQMAVGLFNGQEQTGTIVYDLGTHLTNDPGQNAFITDITNPWPTTYNPSYCGIWTENPNPVWAVGNTWTYDVSGVGQGWNQGADPMGEYKTGSTFIVGPSVNVVAGNVPPHRPTIFGQPNVPWNHSTGAAIGSQGGPRIVLEP